MIDTIHVCRIWTVLVAGLVLLPAVGGMAQDDPFAQPDDPFAQPAAPAAAAAPAPLDESPAPAARIDTATTRAIIETSPQTPAQLLNAIDMLLNLDRDDLAAGYVQQILDTDIDDVQLFELYRSAGADKIIRLGLRAGLGANGVAVSRKIVDGAERFAASEQRISDLIQQLVSEDTRQQSRALGDLRLLGENGAAALIDLLRDDQYQPWWPRIRQAISYFGDVALAPLVAAWNSNSAKLRAEALLALGNISSQEAIETLLGPALLDPGSVNQQVAARSLQKLMNRMPDQAESELMLYRAARDNLMGYVAGGDDARDVKWWRWDPDSRKLVVSWLNAQTATRIRGYRRARDLVALNPQRDDFQRLHWVARLESARLAGGVDLPLPAGVRDQLASQVDADFVNRVLDDAIELHRIPAAIAATELLAVSGDHTLLESTNGMPAPLVRALNVGSVRLAHAAVQTIHQLDPEQSFVGSSRYIDALVFLSRSTGSRLALVGHVNQETGQLLATQLGRSGLDGMAVTSAQALLEQANSNPDLQLLVVTDQLGAPGFTELLQTLRHNPRTALVPVLLLVQSRNLPAAQRLAGRYSSVLASPVVADEILLARQLDNLLSSSVYDDAASAERELFGQSALNHLATYAEQLDRYPFFDLTRHEQELSRLLASPSRALQTCQLLGRIGTADAQLNLVHTANNIHFPEPLRRAATASFADAVRRSGLMLDRAAIQFQYELYNSSGQESPETREILGTLLDIIERRSRNAGR